MKRVSHHGFHSVEIEDVVLEPNGKLPCSSLHLRRNYSIHIIYDVPYLYVPLRNQRLIVLWDNKLKPALIADSRLGCEFLIQSPIKELYEIVVPHDRYRTKWARPRFTCGCEVGIDIGIGFLPSDFCPSSGSNRIQVIGDIWRVWIRIPDGDVVHLGASATMAGNNDRRAVKYVEIPCERGQYIIVVEILRFRAYRIRSALVAWSNLHNSWVFNMQYWVEIYLSLATTRWSPGWVSVTDYGRRNEGVVWVVCSVGDILCQRILRRCKFKIISLNNMLKESQLNHLRHREPSG